MEKPPFDILYALYRADCSWGAEQRAEWDATPNRAPRTFVRLFADVPKVGRLTKELPFDAVTDKGYPVAHLIELLRERAPNFRPVREWLRDEGHYRVELRVPALRNIGEVVERGLAGSFDASEYTYIARMALKQMTPEDRSAVLEAVEKGLRKSAQGKEPLLSAVTAEVRDSVQLKLLFLQRGELNATIERKDEQGNALLTLKHVCEVAPLRTWRCWVHAAVDELPGQELPDVDDDD